MSYRQPQALVVALVFLLTQSALAIGNRTAEELELMQGFPPPPENIYLDAVAQVVVIKQSSSPDAEGGANDLNDTDGPMLYQAIAEHLMKRATQ